MKLEDMRQRKAELGYSNEQIADLSGVPLSTVQKIFAGITKRPRYETLMALEDVLHPASSRVKEPAVPAYAAKKQGEYTIEDYKQMPEDYRCELIDGVIYDLAAPGSMHQYVIFAIANKIDAFIKQNKGKCKIGVAPFDVYLSKEDDKTVVQPDIHVVCDRSKISHRGIEGAPDLVIEILSPSTKKKDSTIKLKKYFDAGVRECWLVDLEKKRVIVYTREDETLPTKIYTFNDKIPVNIFDGQFEMDMKAVYEEVAFLEKLE